MALDTVCPLGAQHASPQLSEPGHASSVAVEKEIVKDRVCG